MADSSRVPPPGFPPVASDTAAPTPDATADAMNALAVQNDVDQPDTTIKSGGLRDTSTAVETKTDGATLYKSVKTFEDLGLAAELLQGLYSEMSFERPSNIQATTLPMILQPPYKHLVAQAQNGSGKTTCFVLAMLSRVDTSLQETQSICVCPTRELVLQNLSVAKKMGKYTKLTYHSTANDLERMEKCRSQVFFATHGRLKNWVRRQQVTLQHIKACFHRSPNDHLDQRDAFRFWCSMKQITCWSNRVLRMTVFV